MTPAEEEPPGAQQVGHQPADVIERRDWLEWVGWVLVFVLLMVLIVAVSTVISS